MISYRLKGLISLHKMVVTFVAAAWLKVYADIVRAIPGGVDLHQNVRVPAYMFAVAAALVVSARYLNFMSPDYHRFTWIHSVHLTIRQIVLVALSILIMMFARKDPIVSRLFVLTFLLSLSVMLLFMNACLPRFLTRLAFHRDNYLPTLFIGSSRTLEHLKEWLAAKEALGLKAVGILSDDPIPAGREQFSAGYSFLGPTTDLKRVIDRHLVAQVVVLDVPKDQEKIHTVIDVCQDSGCRLLIYSNLPEAVGHSLVAVKEQGHEFYSLQDEPLENPVNRTVKRIFDVALALPIVVFLLPPLALVVWVAQRFQAPGDLLIKQRRSGRLGTQFEILKFRSMYSDWRNSVHGSRQAIRQDLRIYPFGSFLRKCSLDEFPQFINVLRGDMSIVGPRPHMLVHDKQFAYFRPGYRTRFIVKPGITGLAQCRGFRGEITDQVLLEKRVSTDLEYISSWSIWLDLQIVLLTAWQVINPPKSAY